MDKKEIIQQAEQFIQKDLLYGLYNGILLKDYIESKADLFVKDNENASQLAKRLTTGFNKMVDSGKLITASESVSDKETIDEFIQSLPYSGTLRNTKDTTINIADEIRKYCEVKNEDGTYGMFHKSLKDIYRLLLTANEFIPPTRMEKVEEVIRIINDLRSIKEDFDEISKTSIKNETFEDMIKGLVDKIDDEFKVDGMELDDYINNKYNQYSLRRYNSVDSKPQNVEQIGLTANGNNLEITNEYIFLTPEENESIINSDNMDYASRSSLHQTIINVINGINSAKTLDTLQSYDERISLIRESINSTFKDDNLLNELYKAMVSKYAQQEDKIEWDEDNRDDVDMLFRSDLNTIKEELAELEADYYRTYENIEDRLRQIKSEVFDYKIRAQKLGIPMKFELDDLYRRIIKLETVYNYSLGNISHDQVRAENDILDLQMQIDSLERSTPMSNPEKVANEVRIEQKKKEQDKMLDDDLSNKIISIDFYDRIKGRNTQKVA